MEVNSLPSAAQYLDTFDLSDDLNNYTYGHIFRIYIAENRKVMATLKAFTNRFVDIDSKAAYSMVTLCKGKFTKAVRRIHQKSGGDNYKLLCSTKINLKYTLTPSTSSNATASSTSAACSTPNCKLTMASSVCGLIEFMKLVGRLKSTVRTGWAKRNVPEPESVADHMYRMAMMSFLIEPTSQLDKTKCMKMSLVHDLAECIVGDITPTCGISKEEKNKREKEAMDEISALLSAPVKFEILHLWQEYEHQETRESQFVKDLDRFDMILQAHEYEETSGRTDGWLQEFFDSTKGKFNSTQVRQWVSELNSLRNKQLTPSSEPNEQNR